MSTSLRPTVSVPDLLREAVGLRRRFEVTQALTLLEDALPSIDNPIDKARLLVAVGDCHKDKKRFGPAVEVFTQATELDPRNPFAAISLRMLLVRMNQSDKAEPHFKRALGVEPQNTYALYGMVKVCANLNRIPEGKTYYDQLKTYERNPRVLDDAAYRLSLHAGSAAAPAKPVPASPAPATTAAQPATGSTDIIESFRSAGMTGRAPKALPKGDHRRAQSQQDAPPPAQALPTDPLERLKLQVEAEPRNVGARKMLADILVRREEFIEAATHLKTILGIDTKNAPARDLLAKIARHLPSEDTQDAPALKRVFRVPAQAMTEPPAVTVTAGPADAPPPAPSVKEEPQGQWVDQYEISVTVDGQQVGQMTFNLPLDEDGKTSIPLDLVFQTAMAATLQNTATHKSRRLVAPAEDAQANWTQNVVPFERKHS